MAFKVRATRNETKPGAYNLAFGKGKNKLVGEMLPSVPPQPAGKFQVLINGAPHVGMARQCKEWWGDWCLQNYKGENGSDEDTDADEEPAPAMSTPPRATSKPVAEDDTPDTVAGRYRVYITGHRAGPPPQCSESSVARSSDRILVKFTLTNGATLAVNLSDSGARSLIERIGGMLPQ